MDLIEVDCPICKRKHKFEKKIDLFYCKGKPIALIKDRKGWRLMEVKVISEKEDRELDKVW
uniref:Uncharacterized protein n=1 Tax=Geoglobus ahangari TaxID=113653 RepID=A0A7C4WEP3_9EURY